MKKFVIVGVVLILVAAIAAGAASQFTLSALPEPGRAETFLATKAKHYLVDLPPIFSPGIMRHSPGFGFRA